MFKRIAKWASRNSEVDSYLRYLETRVGLLVERISKLESSNYTLKDLYLEALGRIEQLESKRQRTAPRKKRKK